MLFKMRKISFFFLLLLLASVVSGQKRKLIWSDEFSGNGLPDSTKWNYDIGGHGWGNNELQYYTAKQYKKCPY